MENFVNFTQSVREVVPDWVALIVFPALILFFAVLFTVFGARWAYAPVCFVLVGLGTFFAGNAAAFSYATIACSYSGLCAFLFFIPCPFGKARKEKRALKRKKRDEEIYTRFHAELEEGGEAPQEDIPLATAEECGTCLAHGSSLLEKLRKEKLSPADRLEVEALTHTIEAYRGRALTQRELHLVNDCLATVLKLTAKYKL